MHNIHSTTDGYPALSTAVAKKKQKINEKRNYKWKKFCVRMDLCNIVDKKFCLEDDLVA